MVTEHGGKGTRGPTCPVCGKPTTWLTDAEAVSLYYQCGTCLRVFEFYRDVAVWWPNDQGVAPYPRGAAADKVYALREVEGR